jgi:hypothetical protein
MGRAAHGCDARVQNRVLDHLTSGLHRPEWKVVSTDFWPRGFSEVHR